MADKSEKKSEIQCPLSKEQQEQVKQFADTVEKHRVIIEKIIGKN